VITPTQGLYIYRTAQHRKTKTNIHAVSGIRTHDLSDQAIKAYASDRAAAGSGNTSDDDND
jgi:cytochrome c553